MNAKRPKSDGPFRTTGWGPFPLPGEKKLLKALEVERQQAEAESTSTEPAPQDPDPRPDTREASDR